MSHIDKDAIKKVAHLARIHLDEADAEHFSQELTVILDWVEQLSEVDTDSVSPLTSPVETILYERPDVVNDGNQRDHLLKNAPDSQTGFFTVPKVIE